MTLEHYLAWTGLAVIGGGVVACWKYLHGIFTQLQNRVITHTDYYGTAAALVLNELERQSKRSRFSVVNFSSIFMYVRPLRKVACVGFRAFSDSQLFWRGWLPIFASPVNGKNMNIEDLWSAANPRSLRLTYLRGTMDPEDILKKALKRYNDACAAEQGHIQDRYRIVHITGTDGKPSQFSGSSAGSEGASIAGPRIATSDNAIDLRERALGWTMEELGPEIGQRSMTALALSPAAEHLVESVRRWYQSRDWYQEHNLPWRLGCLFYGPPGSGKTATVRALAEELDLPVYAYDLATLYNDELRRNWQSMLGNTPCIALIEDLDAVFKGRENTHGHLTFDCLLNCIDGIERTDGLLLIVTTNREELLDDALGVPNDSGISTRPGRLDRVVRFGPLDFAGRRKLVQRILNEHSQLWDQIVDEGDGDTGAQFQDRCGRLALQLFWEQQEEELSEAVRCLEVCE